MGEKIERFVSCVVLCRGASDPLVEFLNELSAVLKSRVVDHEIVLVDDQLEPSVNAAIEHALDALPYVRVLRLTQPKGDHVAFTAGLAASLGDYVCVLDSSNDLPELVPQAVLSAIAGADVVLGIDRGLSRRGLYSGILQRAFGWYAQRYLRLDILSGMGSFRCLSRYAVNTLTGLSQPHRYYRIWGDYVGLTSVRTAYEGRATRKGRSLLASIDEAIDIAISTSAHPLRILSSLAVFFACGNLLYIAYILGIFLWKPQVASGWTTLSLQIAASSLIMIVLLAALGEYVGRLMERSSPNPAYWVLEERTSKRFADGTRRNVVEHSASTNLSAPHR